MRYLTEEEHEQFTDAMLKKIKLLPKLDPFMPDDEHFRHLVEVVIVDTQLVTVGDVPLERWLED